MAEPGSWPWNATDVIRDGLPRRRLKAVAASESLCIVFYEHGGLRRVMTLLRSACLAMELARFGIRPSLPMSRIRRTFAMRFVGRRMETNDIDLAEDGAHPLFLSLAHSQFSDPAYLSARKTRLKHMSQGWVFRHGGVFEQ